MLRIHSRANDGRLPAMLVARELVAMLTLHLSLDFFLKTVNLLAIWPQSFQQPPVEVPAVTQACNLCSVGHFLRAAE